MNFFYKKKNIFRSIRFTSCLLMDEQVLDDLREARKSLLRSEVVLFSVKPFLLRELSRQNANLCGR